MENEERDAGARRSVPLLLLRLYGAVPRRHPPPFLERPAQDELDLRVETPELVVSPLLQRVVDARVDPEQECLALGHGTILVVQRPRVDDRLRVAIAAEHDEQVAHHRRLALLVELDDVLLAEQIERHLDHSDGPLDDLRARRDARACWRWSIAEAISGA